MENCQIKIKRSSGEKSKQRNKYLQGIFNICVKLGKLDIYMQAIILKVGIIMIHIGLHAIDFLLNCNLVTPFKEMCSNILLFGIFIVYTWSMEYHRIKKCIPIDICKLHILKITQKKSQNKHTY